MAPKTIIRGGGTLDSTNRVRSAVQRDPLSETAKAPVRPASSMARVSATAVRSSSGCPSRPPSYEPSGWTSSALPSSSAGPRATRATAAGSPRAAADSAAANTLRPGASAVTGVTRTSMDPPQVSPTAKASSAL